MSLVVYMGLCEELSQLCELLYNAVLQAYRGLSNGLIQCNVVLQAYADHGMTEELNVESARSLYGQELNAIDVHMKLDYVNLFCGYKSFFRNLISMYGGW
ncbi:hypothetical protein NC652_012114 [Populus alba x Populus x berolinensis]|nr:hypothetical protein NC652_012114 [Populus alba x Populus x berolinensis]